MSDFDASPHETKLAYALKKERVILCTMLPYTRRLNLEKMYVNEDIFDDVYSVNWENLL
jgi:hypothetical protein